MAVYVVQKQMRFDHTTGDLVPKFDLAPAEEYGELRYLLSPSAAPFDTANILADLSRGLEEFTSEDHLLLIGNPVLIGMASAIAADIAGTVRFLQWSGKERRYLEIVANILS